MPKIAAAILEEMDPNVESLNIVGT